MKLAPKNIHSKQVGVTALINTRVLLFSTPWITDRPKIQNTAAKSTVSNPGTERRPNKVKSRSTRHPALS